MELIMPTGRSGSQKKSSSWIIVIIVLAVVLVGLYMTCGRGSEDTGARAARVVPVVVAEAETGSLPVILSSLGTVTPTDVVTVKTRVNGHLQNVAFREGQMVRQGDLLAEIDPRPYEVQLMQAEGQLAKNQAALNNAMRDLERYKNMVERGVYSIQQLDSQTAQAEQLAAAVKSDEGSVESAKLNLTYCRITAPISGRVGLRYVDPGNLVNQNDPNGIVVITPLSPIHVVFSVSEASISQVVTKDHSKMKVEAWYRDMTAKLADGKVWAIDNQVDRTTGMVKIKALFDNQDSSLFPNQSVNMRLYVDTSENVVLLPNASVQIGPQGTFVYVVKDDLKVELREVEVAARQGDLAALKSGLENGETVVTEGMERLRPGSAVTIPGAEPAQAGGETRGEIGSGPRQGRAGP
jgi:multidrug efflux system membrane fusion protein